MYRQYEDASILKCRLKETKKKYSEVCEKARNENRFVELLDQMFVLHSQIEDLKERINFAVQDYEHDSFY